MNIYIQLQWNKWNSSTKNSNSFEMLGLTQSRKAVDY